MKHDKVQLHTIQDIVPFKNKVVIVEHIDEVKPYIPQEDKLTYITNTYKKKQSTVELNELTHSSWFIVIPANKKEFQKREFVRKAAYDIYQQVRYMEEIELQIDFIQSDKSLLYAFAEGFALSAYSFDKYKKQAEEQSISLHIVKGEKSTLQELKNVITSNFLCRDMVNEPNVYQSAMELSQTFKDMGKEAGFDVEVLTIDQIKTLKMGGLLAVNRGSVEPPSFSVLEYLPENPKNAQPVVLVGKGVVYDTGGISLKPSMGGFMEYMKSDMAGAAVVASTIYAIAKNKLPIHIVGLIPATDNRPGGNALVPGDIITMMSGTTVEVINTDAEGRLILADALTYAKRYNPSIVIDLATLTGSSVAAIGREGVVYMGKAPINLKNDLENIGRDVYERVVEFPLWEEYGEQLKSEVADIKNLGGPTAGMITAGKFLQHFTDYKWLHFDIAGPSFTPTPDNYRGIHATGIGTRLLYHFLKSYITKE